MALGNEVSGRVEGTVVQIGIAGGDVYVEAGAPVRSAYLSQVQALAPGSLRDRSTELAMLAEFCTSESTAQGYLWWRASAWSGKSALLSWFVLHPPAGVRTVSFFVTSRLPGQNDRRGFVDSALEQLHDLAGRRARTDLTDATREPYLRQQLADVARQVHERGEHFVLVVDGLDEDRGVDGSADAHSIAALLPRRGVRVIVASRPDPELPDDVPEDHPLRGSAQVEHLSPSPEAHAVRDAMIRDLKRLLSGSQLQQDLLGFLTASGGGLTVRDLAELIEVSPWQVEDDLSTAAGRSFSRRPGDPPVYLLAHEQLRVRAEKMLGPQLRTYQERISRWAARYLSEGWPRNTPPYLLQGYASLLSATGDQERLLHHVTDPQRRELAFAVTGSHRALLGEIELAQAAFLSAREPDLTALSRLSVHRTSLQADGNWIPGALPAMWARLGRVDHAEALIQLISSPGFRARALMRTAKELHHLGHQGQVTAMLDAAEAITFAFNQFIRPFLHHELTDLAAHIGDFDRAQRVVDDIRNAGEKVVACASVTLIALSTSNREHANLWHQKTEGMFSAISDHRHNEGHALAFALMAAVTAQLGDTKKSAELAATAADLQSAHDPWSTGELTRVVTTLTRSGYTEVALSVADAQTSVDDREHAVRQILMATAIPRDLDGAEAIARAVDEIQYRSARLAAVALAASRGGEHSRADSLRVEAEAALDDIAVGDVRQFIIAVAAVTAAETGQCEIAEQAVHAHLLPSGVFHESLLVAAELLHHSELDRAQRMLEEIEHAVRSASPTRDENRLSAWIGIMADFGDLDRAEPVAHSLRDSEIRAAAWERLAEAIATTGNLHRFESALTEITRPSRQRRPRMEMIRVLLARGDEDDALRLARSASVTTQQATALDFIARVTRRRELLDEVIALATSPDLAEQRFILLHALRTAAEFGDRTAADLLFRRLHTIHDQLKSIAKQTDGHAGYLPLPKHMRTLTELAEMIESSLKPEVKDETAPILWGGAPPLFSGSEYNVPFRTRLAQALAIGSWLDVVDRVVDEDPDAYAAIVTELDRLGIGEL
ncbi:hypothetical protein JOD54_006738 [Actinokineospora baliensis]|uniref:hypothetical protein n=1 Tax=Actinokineospora baliensis TaxID=547056 RepID=UPI00195BFBB3|nr:hypothetical protein [Actinokineospora baliensis]MBM7776534.1 hypothetical protein [Actinokineospora baliensis]